MPQRSMKRKNSSRKRHDTSHSRNNTKHTALGLGRGRIQNETTASKHQTGGRNGHSFFRHTGRHVTTTNNTRISFIFHSMGVILEFLELFSGGMVGRRHKCLSTILGYFLPVDLTLPLERSGSWRNASFEATLFSHEQKPACSKFSAHNHFFFLPMPICSS